MSRRFIKHIVIIISILLVSLMGTYIGLAIYYHNAFAYGTWINGVYCTGRSISDVNSELVKGFSYEGITIYDRKGGSCQISAEEIAYRFDFARALEIYQKQQNSWTWIDSLFRDNSTRLTPVVSYNKQALEEILQSLPCLKEAEELTDSERRVAIVRTAQGYELQNERTDVLSVKEAKEAIIHAIEESSPELSLSEAGCYHDLELDTQMKDTLKLWDKINALQQCGIIYQMGEDQVPVDASVVCGWIELTEDGSFVLDEQGNPKLRENAMEEFVNALADEYDTVGASRLFQATRGETVTVEGGIYGNKLDRKAEIKYLTEAFSDGRREIHEPEYTQKAWKQGKDDIGDTYVEVDMGEQMMYYYVNGVQKLSTPVVTGNTSRRMGTPSGVNYVYSKQRNRVLRGPGYASPVDFWMPVKGGIGIHDASWRSKYGGTIYQTNGSHGCINTPRDIMVELYDSVEVGTPVVMFY